MQCPPCAFIYACVLMLLEPSCFVLLSGQASRQDDWCSRPFGKGQIKPNANTHAVSAWPGPEDPCSSPPASPARATPAFGNTDTGQSACMPARLGGLMVQPHVGVPAPLPVCPAPKLHAMKAKKKKGKKEKNPSMENARLSFPAAVRLKTWLQEDIRNGGASNMA
jgi:hypothetical protein